MPSMRKKCLYILTEYSVWIGLAIRFFVAWTLPWLLDNERFIPGVAYTDIDFYVFSDAAEYIKNGVSPYQRTTYRYTPFLASFLSILPNRECGRYIFCIADTICGYIIVLYRRNNRADGVADSSNSKKNNDEWAMTRFYDTLWWLYNPLAINICTRGSAESLVVLLPVLISVWIASSPAASRRGLSSWAAAILAGLCHGVAIHAKLYPVIYTVSFMTAFVTKRSDGRALHSGHLSQGRQWALMEVLLLWMRRLLTPAPLLFATTAVVTFGICTYAAVRWYGPEALQEGLLYHFSRVDHRHNYSMHWYWIYLLRDRIADSGDARLMTYVGQILLLPQLLLLAYTSLGVAPASLSLAMYIQTFLFVAQNKVITAQYFTWYLCLLPLCNDQFRWTQRVRHAAVIFVASILFWLGSAYCLEMQGMAVHGIVWLASLIFFGANVNLLGALLSTAVIGRDSRELEKRKGD